MSKLQQAAVSDGTEVEIRQPCCWIAHVGSKIFIIPVVNLKGTDVLYYYIFWQTSSTPKTTNSKPLNNFCNENHSMHPAKKTSVALTTWLPGHKSVCKARLWHDGDKLDCMNYYPDISPEQHQSLWLESVKVKSFQCFSWAMYRDNSCNEFWERGK